MVDVPLSLSIADADDPSPVDLEVSFLAEDATQPPERLFDGRLEQAARRGAPRAAGARTEGAAKFEPDTPAAAKQGTSGEQFETRLAGHTEPTPGEHAHGLREVRSAPLPADHGGDAPAAHGASAQAAHAQTTPAEHREGAVGEHHEAAIGGHADAGMGEHCETASAEHRDAASAEQRDAASAEHRDAASAVQRDAASAEQRDAASGARDTRAAPTAAAAGALVLGGLYSVRATAAALGARVLGGAGAVHVLGGVPVQAVVGLGAWAELSAETLRRAAAHAVVYATDLRRTTLAINVPDALPPSITLAAAVQAMAEGALLAADARQPRATITPTADTALPPTRCVLRLPHVRAPDPDDVAAEPRRGVPDAAAGGFPSTPASASVDADVQAAAAADGATVADHPGLREGGSDARAEPAPGQGNAAASSARLAAPSCAAPAAPSCAGPAAASCAEPAAPSCAAPAAASCADLAAVLSRARSHVAAVSLARQLADMPANRMSPRQLADQAAFAVHALGLSSEILGPRELEHLGAGLLLAVGAGSARPPALGVIRYAPPGAARHVAVVGKGITFDAGGISVKPAKGMADMVHDKAGAAAAAAIAFGAALLELPIAVTALVACAENLPSGAAYRPGDVLQGMDGATVEVVDTDAEGRLVLADALTYAVRLTEPRQVDVLIDLATLTGSIVSALGNEAAGLFSNNDVLAARMLEAASAAGEPLWRMPILAGHRAQLKSERADRKQCADRVGDCAIAAAFLEMYVDKRPWLHLDIAGVAYNEGSPEWPPYHPKTGAGGAGVRTVLHFLEALCAQVAGST
jgi:leucyl aminopeptidase